jgi:hypothetical protein
MPQESPSESTPSSNRTEAGTASPKTTEPTDRRALLAGIGGLAAGALMVGPRTAQAGPINPPPGPVASTGKTLTEVEPRIAINSTNTPGSSATSSIFRITQPGSYYLTGNIIATQGNRHVISISADGVTIDLNGFLIRGLGNLQGAFDGIFAEAGAERITIRNGYVELAGRHGINLATANGCTVENVNAALCLGKGIYVGNSANLTACTARQNGSEGIEAFENARLYRCSATNCANGISAQTGTLLSECVAAQNLGAGFSLSFKVTVVACVAHANATSGFFALGSSHFANCVASNNGADGFALNSFSAVVDCMASDNVARGISCPQYCHILRCNCEGNDVGIDAGGDDNRIEGNTCTRNQRGINVPGGTGNLVIANFCANNTTNYFIVAGNRYGPIVNITSTGTAAVNGNSAASTLGSTDPHANFAG